MDTINRRGASEAEDSVDLSITLKLGVSSIVSLWRWINRSSSLENRRGVGNTIVEDRDSGLEDEGGGVRFRFRVWGVGSMALRISIQWFQVKEKED